MNWFRVMLARASKFFFMAAKTAIGIAANDISKVVLEIVKDLEQHNQLSGKDKKRMAINMVKKEYPNAESAVINLAIETAVAIVKDLTNK